MKRILFFISIIFIAFCFLSCSSGSRAYKIEKVKIYLDEGEWSKALDLLDELDDDDEVKRLRAGAFGGKAGLSVIQMGLKFIGKDDSNEGSDFFSFLESIGVTSHVACGSDYCIDKGITELSNLVSKKSSDYFLRAFFRLYRATVNFLAITNITDLNQSDLLSDGLSGKVKISCYINTLQIEVGAIQLDLALAGVASSDSFFTAINEMFDKLTHCAAYNTGALNNAQHQACAAGGVDSGSCKWACSAVYVQEVIVDGGSWDNADDAFNGKQPDGSGTETLCSAGGVAAGAIDWAGAGMTAPDNFALVSSSEAIGGMLENIGAN